MKYRGKRGIHILLTVAMIFSVLPSNPVSAQGYSYEKGLCEHHNRHTEDCGFIVGEASCAYECEECKKEESKIEKDDSSKKEEGTEEEDEIEKDDASKKEEETEKEEKVEKGDSSKKEEEEKVKNGDSSKKKEEEKVENDDSSKKEEEEKVEKDDSSKDGEKTEGGVFNNPSDKEETEEEKEEKTKEEEIEEEEEIGEEELTPEFLSLLRSGTVVPVSKPEEFMEAIQQENVTIVVSGLITLGDEADSDGRMRPVFIKEGTTIKGDGNAILVFHSPLQIEGDNVTFSNIEMQFTSTDALYAVPHREIFLAGHSLTLDNVKTYVKGADGSLGPLGGTEKELLPTVYAGGYRGTQIGKKASLTITNANDDTVFQGIYLAHKDEGYDFVRYTGTVTLNLDAKTAVRDGVFSAGTNLANITVKNNGGLGSVRCRTFIGSDFTNLTLDAVSLLDAEVSGGTIYLTNNSTLKLVKGNLEDINLGKGSTLNLYDMGNVTIEGDFSGGGNLILHPEGSLNIKGDINGTTYFTTAEMGQGYEVESGKTYITGSNARDGNFELYNMANPDWYEVVYSNGGWQVNQTYVEEEFRITEIDVLSAPTAVDLKTITHDNSTVPKEAPLQIVWRDWAFEAIPQSVIEEMVLPDGYMVIMNTEYWNDEEYQYDRETDWGNNLSLSVVPDGGENTYYLHSSTMPIGNNPAPDPPKEGNYTLFLLKDYVDLSDVDDGSGSGGTRPLTVREVKEKLWIGSDIYIAAEIPLTLYNSEDTVVGKDINDVEFLPIEDQKYTGEGLTPTVEVKDGSVAEGKDYIVSYKNNVAVGEATVEIVGQGDYSGKKALNFQIVEADAELSLTANYASEEAYVTYGDKIEFAFQASVKKEANKARTAALNTVEFYCGETLLGEATIDKSGKARFVYDTKDKKIPIGDAVVGVEFGGSATLNPATKEDIITIHLQPKSVSVQSLSVQDFAYDGEKQTTEILSGTMVEEGVDVTISGTVKFDSAEVGSYSEAQVLNCSLSKDDTPWYELREIPNSELYRVPLSPEAKIYKGKAPVLAEINRVEKPSTSDITIDVKSLIEEKYRSSVETIMMGEYNTQSSALLSRPSIIDGTLKYSTNQVGEQDIPLRVSFNNYEDAVLVIHVTVENKDFITLNLTAPDTVYDGEPYDEWSCDKENATVTFYDLTKGEELLEAPTLAGSYSVTVSYDDATSMGKETKNFTIAAKEIKVKALDKVMTAGDTLPLLTSPIEGTDYEFESGYEPLEADKNSWGKVVMSYDEGIDGTLGGTSTIWLLTDNVDDTKYTVTPANGTLNVVGGYVITVKNGSADKIAANEGETITVTAGGKEGAGFVKWTGDADVEFADKTQEETTFVMPAHAVTVTAEYADFHTVTMENGTADKTTAKQGDTVTITADNIDGKGFVKWAEEKNVTYADETQEKTTFVMPDNDVTIRAEYADAYDVAVENGSADKTQAKQGATVTITADSIEGKEFVQWTTEDTDVIFADKTQEETTFIMPNHAVTVTAEYADAYDVTVENGSADKTQAKQGATVTITANRIEGKEFVKWTTEDEGVVFADATKEETTFVMPGHAVTITAVYEDIVTPPGSYSVIVENGTADKATAKKGDTVTITANSIAGKKFVKWTGDADVVFADAAKEETTFIMPDHAVTVTAEYKDIVSVAVTGVKLDKTSLSLYTGAVEQLKAQIEPADAVNQEVTWQSSNPAVATVDENGKVTALTQGQTVITVTTAEGGYQADCTVEVTTRDASDVLVTGVTLNKEGINLQKGKKVTLTATITPSDATDTTLSWESDNEKVATVDENGVVTGVAKGTATITVTTKDGGYTATCKITVEGSSSSGGGSSSGGSSGGSTVKAEDFITGVTKTISSDINGDSKISEETVKTALDKALKEAKQNGIDDIYIRVPLESEEEQNFLDVVLDSEALDMLVAKEVQGLEFYAKDFVSMQMPLDTLKELHRVSDGGRLVFRVVDQSILSEAAKAVIGNRPVYDITLSYISDGMETKITDLDGNSVTIELSYDLYANENASDLRAVYVDDSGTITWIDDTEYDTKKNTIVFETDHFSIYGVGSLADASKTVEGPGINSKEIPVQGVPAFTDIAGHWAENDIIFVTERNLFSGTSATLFSPNMGLTRGMFVTVLGRLYGVDTSLYQTTAFTDVPQDSYYSPYISWAAQNGIVSGTSKTMFSPDKLITRQEMAVIMKNYADACGYSLPTGESVSFTDNSELGSWALEAVDAVKQSGILSGRDDGRFDPQGTATRGEAASVLRRFMEKAVKF